MEAMDPERQLMIAMSQRPMYALYPNRNRAKNRAHRIEADDGMHQIVRALVFVM